MESPCEPYNDSAMRRIYGKSPYIQIRDQQPVLMVIKSMYVWATTDENSRFLFNQWKIFSIFHAKYGISYKWNWNFDIETDVSGVSSQTPVDNKRLTCCAQETD